MTDAELTLVEELVAALRAGEPIDGVAAGLDPTLVQLTAALTGELAETGRLAGRGIPLGFGSVWQQVSALGGIGASGAGGAGVAAGGSGGAAGGPGGAPGSGATGVTVTTTAGSNAWQGTASTGGTSGAAASPESVIEELEHITHRASLSGDSSTTVPGSWPSSLRMVTS